MRWFAAVLFVGFSAIAAIAQIVQIAPVPYGFSNSVIDHNGRLLIFDASYLYPPPVAMPTVQAIPVRFPPIVRTRVTVIESDASSKQDVQYDGTLQVIGVGRYAVYAIVTNYAIAAASAQAPFSLTRQLVAFGPSFPSLPSVDVPLQTDVKVSAVGNDGELDTITFVDNVVRPLLMGVPAGIVSPVPPIPAVPRTAQMFRSDGKSFKALPPVVLTSP